MIWAEVRATTSDEKVGISLSEWMVEKLLTRLEDMLEIQKEDLKRVEKSLCSLVELRSRVGCRTK